MYEVPTLFTDLVDRANPRAPSILMRSSVCVLVEECPWEANGGRRTLLQATDENVAVGNLLGLGDVVVVCGAAASGLAWLAEVVDASVSGSTRSYTLAYLGATTVEQWVLRNDDARWSESCGAVPPR